MEMKTRIKIALLLTLSLIALLIMTGCTNKDNLTGNNWSDVAPQSFADSSSFYGGFSYPGTKTVNGLESNLLCGDFQGKEAITVLRFTGLPDSLQIPAAHQDSTWLELTLVKRSPLGRNPVELSIYKLNQLWAADSTSLIQDANMTEEITTQAFTIPDTILAAGTVVKIPIPYAKIQDWSSTADSLGFNLVLKTNADSYLELRSTETGRGPKLRFTYTAGTDTTKVTYNTNPTRDSYRVTAEAAPLLPGQWVIQNISPSRILVNFGLDYNLFKDSAGNILSEKDRKRVTINKAELVLYVKDNPYYIAPTQYNLRADWLKDSLNVALPVAIADDKLTTGLTYQAAVRDNYIVVNVIQIVQAFSSGDIDSWNDQPWGVVIRSNQELLNFGKLELWQADDPNIPAGMKPKLKVTYTPPYL